MIRDFRLAVRSLLRVPGFTVVAVLTLAVGLGTTTLLLLAVAAAASWWPAHRATRVDPLSTLRAQ